MGKPVDKRTFAAIVKKFYRQNRRALPWRDTRDPYAILVSELMLQQTQVARVISKYEAFLKQFPTVWVLAKAPAGEVVRVWQGLGYNRRALALQRAAQAIVSQHGGRVPTDIAALDALPGVGAYTASAVVVFAFDRPVPMIETNIRRVYIHHFFPHADSVSDVDILPLIEATIDRRNPREWYYALMDYGSILPKQIANPNRRSKAYHRQSPFAGSRRQMRGAILRACSTGPISLRRLRSKFSKGPHDVHAIIRELKKEGFVVVHKDVLRLAA